MPSSLSTIVAKDGTPATIVGGLLAVDKSGAGTGPFFAAQTLVDTQGVNTATIKAASTAVAAGDTAFSVGLHPTSPLPAGTNVIGHVIVDTAPSTAVTNTGTFATQSTLAAETTKVIGVVRTADGSGNLLTSTANALDINIKSGANPNGQAVMASSAPVVIASNQSAIPVNPAAAATGGATNLHFFSVTGAPAAVAIKASAGTLYGLQAVNTGAAPVYLKIYNLAAGSVVVGTTVPLYTIPVPTVATTGAGIAISFPVGIVFGTAISYTFTNVAADNDATAVAVGTTLNVQFA
jgi:hypothetical protein